MGLFKYNLWVNSGPGGGVFAVLAGTIMVVCGGMLLMRFMKSNEKVVFEKDAVLMIAAAIITAVLCSIIGMIPALGLYIVLWLKLKEKMSIVNSLLIGVGTAAFLWVVFDLLLNVAVPWGVLPF